MSGDRRQGGRQDERDDIRAVAEIAHRHDAQLLVDNSFASPLVCRPLEWGADWVVESLTKIINGHSDLVLGVHPRHAKFWVRMFGFEAFADESICPIVNNAPVVGIRLDLQALLFRDPLPRGIRQFLKAPIATSEFEGRYEMAAEEWQGTRIETFLRSCRGAALPAGERASLLER